MDAPAGNCSSAVPPLDTADGLDRLLGDQALYGQVLRRFRLDHADTVAQLRQLLDAGAREAALARLHTLKGAAGMIGAAQVHALASAVKAGDVEARLALLEQALPALLAQADAWLAAQAVVEARTAPAAGSAAVAASVAGLPQAAAPELGRLLAARLAVLLDEGNGAAIDVLEQSASTLLAWLGAARFQQVAAAAQQYDFEAALAALQPALVQQ